MLSSTEDSVQSLWDAGYHPSLNSTPHSGPLLQQGHLDKDDVDRSCSVVSYGCQDYKHGHRIKSLQSSVGVAESVQYRS